MGYGSLMHGSRRALLQRRATAPVWTPAKLTFTTGLWLDPSDISTAYQDSAGTTAGQIGSPVGKRLDKSGRGNHVVQGTTTARPTLNSSGSIIFDATDGVDDGYGLTFASGTLGSDMDIFVAIKTADTSAVLLADAPSSSHYVGAMVSGSSSGAAGSAGSPTMFVNNVQVPGGTAVTQGSLSSALATGAWSIFEVHDANLSIWTGLNVASYVSYDLASSIGGIIICPAQTAATRNQIRTWLGNKVGLSL